MKKAPTLYTLTALLHWCSEGAQTADDNKLWWPSRPVGYFSIKSRIKIAWLVFTGKADAVTWPAKQ